MQSKLYAYLIRTFLGSFFPLFFTLFTISSVVAIIKLADITSIIRLGSTDFFKLYLYGVPQLFFYSIPISFFLAASISLSKLSFDSEITAMIALGATKKNIIKPFFILSATFSAILLYLGILLIPASNTTAKLFIEEKKASSKLNLEPNSVGQKFGDWYVFALGENKHIGFTDVVLFSRNFHSDFAETQNSKKNENSSDKIIYSKSAQIIVDSDQPVLQLKNGSALVYDQNLTSLMVRKLKFDLLSLREEIVESNLGIVTFVDYWLQAGSDKKRAKDLTDTILTSFSPIINLLLAFAFGVTMSRRDKNKAVIYSVVAISAYYIMILMITPKITFYAIPLITAVWTFVVYNIYRRSVFAKY